MLSSSALEQLGSAEDWKPVLLKSLGDDDEEVRDEGLSLLCRQRCDAPEVVSALLEMRKSLKPRERIGVDVGLYVLGLEVDDTLIPRLLDSLESQDEMAADGGDERWLTVIGRPAVEEIWKRLFNGRLSVDRALSLLESKEFGLTSEALTPVGSETAMQREQQIAVCRCRPRSTISLVHAAS